MKFTIPKSVPVGSKTYTVTIVDRLSNHARGRTYYETCEIKIAERGIRDIPFEPQEMFETFWHELLHALLYEFNYAEYEDERFVSCLGYNLSHAITGAKL